MLSPGWVIVSVLFPVVGVIGGIYGLATRKENAGALLLLGVGAWIFWMAVY